MKKNILHWLRKFAGMPPLDHMFLMRMRSIERELGNAIINISYPLLNNAFDRLLWEYQFDRSKEEMDLIVEMLRLHERTRIHINSILTSETLCNNYNYPSLSFHAHWLPFLWWAFVVAL